MTTYLLEALNLYDKISIKMIRSALGGKILDSNTQELVLQYSDTSYAFVFRFGCIVFFNVPAELRESELEKLKKTLGPGLSHTTSEVFQIAVGVGESRVEFEYVSLPHLRPDELRVVARTVGQSAALEYFEIQSEKMLGETSTLMSKLAAGGTLPLWWRNLLKRIGSAASTRQHIISNLLVLDPPEETWKSKELEWLYQEVQESFDIAMRFRILDRKLTLVQDNIEILADLASSKRSALLEALIVLLIVLEIALRFAH